MQVYHVNKNMVEQSSTVDCSLLNLEGVLKPYLGLDLIDPRSSSDLFKKPNKERFRVVPPTCPAKKSQVYSERKDME